MKTSGFIYILLLLCITPAMSKDSFKTVRIIPHAEYAAGPFHRFIFGDTWRDLWTTEIEVTVLDPENFAGGLTILRQGGGMQTRSLRFMGENGVEYKFRSIEKFTNRFLPDELQIELVEESVKEMFSTTHPTGMMIVEPIMDAAKLMQARPELYMMPDSPRLGEFREDFAGMFGMMEIHPDEGEDDDTVDFAGSDKVFGSYKLFKKWEHDNDYQIDAHEFLKARLIDFFIGDWDRHYDQWRWAKYEKGKRRLMKPIARDRDQAFCRYDGLVPRAIAYYVIQIESCDAEYPDVFDLSWSGRHLDRKFLAGIDRRSWDSLTNWTVDRLTDSLIIYSVGRMPRPMFDKKGDELIARLIARRDGLRKFSDEFYYLLAEDVEIHGSNKKELCEIIRHKGGKVEVNVFKKDRDKDGKPRPPFYHRIFHPDETNEIRIYLKDGNDDVEMFGNSRGSIPVNIVGGEGKDDFEDESLVTGPLFGFLPIEINRTYTMLYDHGDKSDFDTGPSTSIDRRRIEPPENDTLRFEPYVRDWGDMWWFSPWLELNSDDGLFLGGGPQYFDYGFLRDPYNYKTSLKAGYSLFLNGLGIDYNIHFPNVFIEDNLFVELLYSQVDLTQFYGFGNETEYSMSKYNDGYYDIEHSFLLLNPVYSIELSDYSDARLGGLLKWVDNDLTESKYINKNKPYGYTNMSLLGITGGINFDIRDCDVIPREGFYLDGYATYYPVIFTNKKAFWKSGIEARTYLTQDEVLTESTLALRLVGRKNFGTAPYFESAFAGGHTSLRGYSHDRFAGDAAAYGNAELRFKISNYQIIFPGEIGGIAFADAGRVFLEGETSDILHVTYGGGIWINSIADDYMLSFYLAKSDERWGIYADYGFMF